MLLTLSVLLLLRTGCILRLGWQPLLFLRIPAKLPEGEGKKGVSLPPPLFDSWSLVSTLTSFLFFSQMPLLLDV